MALICEETIKYLKRTSTSLFSSIEWNTLYKSGQIALGSGIYRCEGCGHELACEKGQPFPQSHQHTSGNARKIQWRLIVKAENK